MADLRRSASGPPERPFRWLLARPDHRAEAAHLPQRRSCAPPPAPERTSTCPRRSWCAWSTTPCPTATERRSTCSPPSSTRRRHRRTAGLLLLGKVGGGYRDRPDQDPRARPRQDPALAPHGPRLPGDMGLPTRPLGAVQPDAPGRHARIDPDGIKFLGTVSIVRRSVTDRAPFPLTTLRHSWHARSNASPPAATATPPPTPNLPSLHQTPRPQQLPRTMPL